jgi:hypothetical protein
MTPLLATVAAIAWPMLRLEWERRWRLRWWT